MLRRAGHASAAKKREARKLLGQSAWITLEGGFAARQCMVQDISSSQCADFGDDAATLPSTLAPRRLRAMRAPVTNARWSGAAAEQPAWGRALNLQTHFRVRSVECENSRACSPRCRSHASSAFAGSTRVAPARSRRQRPPIRLPLKQPKYASSGPARPTAPASSRSRARTPACRSAARSASARGSVRR